MLLKLVILVILVVSVAAEVVDLNNGGWLPATELELSMYFSDRCTIPKIPISEMTLERFQEQKLMPFILTFPNGAEDWCDVKQWSTTSLMNSYDGWIVGAGKSIEIVYDGGKPSFNRTFKEYIDEMRKGPIPGQDLTYLFDRSFFFNSSLPQSLKVPEFLFDKGDPILFIGQTGTGAAFHKHMPAWNGVVYGYKRWFLYPLEMTPPGGLHAFTPSHWLQYVYNNLADDKKPIECMQNAGEIFYVKMDTAIHQPGAIELADFLKPLQKCKVLCIKYKPEGTKGRAPESYYHAILNIGETVAISIQMKQAQTPVEAEFYAAIESHYQATVQTDNEQTQQYREKGDKQFSDLHFLLPENVEILSHLSDMACERGDTVRCERLLKLILKIDPFAVGSMKLLSRIYYDREEFEKSENLVLESLRIHPDSKALLREHANFLWNQRKQDSKTAYEKLLSVMDPSTEEARGVHDILSFDFTETVAHTKEAKDEL